MKIIVIGPTHIGLSSAIMEMVNRKDTILIRAESIDDLSPEDKALAMEEQAKQDVKLESKIYKPLEIELPQADMYFPNMSNPWPSPHKSNKWGKGKGKKGMGYR